MLKLFRPRGNKKRAMVFVDYESWYYSYRTLFNLKPDPKTFREDLEKEFKIQDIMIFGDFSSPGIAEELGKLRNITSTIIETGNTYNRRKKDMTDFIMIDYIYQHVDEKNIGTYIIFTGDGHFQSVVKYLKTKKKKNVIVYGVHDSISRQLREAASEVRELPKEEEIKRRYYKLIVRNMEHVYGNPNIIPTFMGTAETVARQNDIEVEEIKNALAEMIDEGYILKSYRKVGHGKFVKVLVPKWEKLKKDGLWH